MSVFLTVGARTSSSDASKLPNAAKCLSGINDNVYIN